MHDLPTIYTIDIANRCNLTCVFCLEGVHYNKQASSMMTLDDFKAISKSFISDAKEINLQNWSEPFLNKDIFDIVKFINDNSDANIIISTNGNVFTEEMAKRLLDLKVYNLMISISGLNNKIYQIYHKDGDIERAYRAISFITDEKIRRKKDNLRKFQIKYLVFDYNFITYRRFRDELIMRLGRKRFKKIDKLDIATGYLTGTTLSFDEQRRIYPKDISRFIRKSPFKYNCRLQLNTMTIRADGKVFYCCGIPYRDEFIAGDLKAQTIEDIWNSDKYTGWRQDYIDGKNSLCNSCFIYNVGLRYLKPMHLFNKIMKRIGIKL